MPAHNETNSKLLLFILTTSIPIINRSESFEIVEASGDMIFNRIMGNVELGRET